MNEIPIARPLIEREELDAVAEVLSSGMLAQGRKTEQLESEFAAYCGTSYAVAVNSGTAALHCALHAAGVSPGDEVITTPFSFVATANAILMQGAVPVFADIVPTTLNIDPAEMEKKITARTKAVLAVHLFGQTSDMESISHLCQEYGLAAIEDACQAHGAMQGEKRAGSLGTAGCFSFYATKNMVTGEGGIITTDDPELAERARSFRNHGRSSGSGYDHLGLGFNYRMTDLAAAIGLNQLRKLDRFNQARRRNASLLNQGLAGIPGIKLPTEAKGHFHVYNQYTVRVTSECAVPRNELAERLGEEGIASGIYYPVPLYRYPHLAGLGSASRDFPVAEAACREVLSLPVHPAVTEEDVRRITETMRRILG